MRIFKNRLVLGIICLILALLTAFVLTPVITNLQTKPVDVITVSSADTIKKGTLITKEMVQVSQVGSYGLPMGTIKNVDDVVGKYTTVDLLPTSYILSSAVADTVGNNIKLETLNGEYTAISFTAPNLASSLSSQLKSGDIISIIATTDEQTYIPHELTYLEILNCTSSNAVDTETKGNDVNEDETKELISTITVFATNQQAIKIAELDKLSSIHVALQYRGNDDNKKVLLDLQKESIKTDDSEDDSPSEDDTSNTDVTDANQAPTSSDDKKDKKEGE